MRLGAKELRDIEEKDLQDRLKQVVRRPLYLVLENIYDTYNIGGLFRLADALSVTKLYLCGQTEIPPNHKIKKASIGTYKVVPWEYKATTREALEEIRKNEKGTVQVVAVEQSEKAVDYTKAEYHLPLALIVGNETYGVLPETLNIADVIVEIPMWGINKSLNVIVSAAIVSYHVTEKTKKSA